MFFGRLLPIVRTFISFPAGVARMPLGSSSSTRRPGAFLWSMLLVYAGTVLGANWVQIRHALQPFDLAIAVGVVARGRALRLVAPRDAGPAAAVRGERPSADRAWRTAPRAAGRPELAVEQQVVDDLEAAGEEERQRRVARRSPSARARATARSPRRSSGRCRSRPAAADRSSGSTTAITYDWRVGTSIWLRLKRSSSTAIASGRVGMSGTRISSTFDGRWVKTIVLISPIRAAIRAADSDETAASRLAPKKIAAEDGRLDAELEVEPVGHQALRDEAAAEGVEREQGRQPQHDPLRAAEPEAAADAVAAAARAAAPRRPAPSRQNPTAIARPISA